MKVLVTGGAGFIGANLCRALVADDRVEEVVVLDDLSTGAEASLAGVDVKMIVGSILDSALLDPLVAGVDSVIHLAARPSVPKSLLDPAASHEVNATGTLRVLEAARANGCHVVVASSSSVYGSTTELPKHEDLPTRPLSPYGVSKLAAETYAIAYAHSFGLPTLAFRFFNVYGPLQAADHDYAAVVPAFISRALSGRPLVIYGDGGQTRDFTFVGSVTAVLTEAVVQRVTSADPVNLAFGTRYSLLDLVQALERTLGMPLTVEHQPPRQGDIRDSQASHHRLLDLFPGATPVSLEDGLDRTVAWFRAH